MAKVSDRVKVQYKVEAVMRYFVKRISTAENAELQEEIALVADIDEARQIAKSMTDYDRRNPDDCSVTVLNYQDAEIH